MRAHGGALGRGTPQRALLHGGGAAPLGHLRIVEEVIAVALLGLVLRGANRHRLVRVVSLGAASAVRRLDLFAIAADLRSELDGILLLE